MINLNIGRRLREERERISFTQPQIAKMANVSKTTQVNYEQGARKPDSEYLFLISEVGIDVQYVLTGVRSLNWPPESEAKIQQISKDELLDTLELIRQESEKGLELVKKMS